MDSKQVYYRVLNENHNHAGFQYRMGLNVYTKPYDAYDPTHSNGLYFTAKEHIGKFLDFGCYIAEITIPDDARVYIDLCEDRWRTNRLFIHKITPIKDMEWWNNEQDCLSLIRQNGKALEYVKNQTPELCLTSVKQNGLTLQYVKEQTAEICLEAVKENGLALQYVVEQTQEICLEAVKQNGLALQYVENQTLELCITAVNQDDDAIQFVKEPYYNACFDIVNSKNNIEYVE